MGRHVPALLAARGFEVHAVGREQVDLLDATATDELVAGIGATHLLHLAWYTEHGKFWDAPENRDWEGATLALARSFRAAGGERMVAAGTCAEYEPSTLYGMTKNATRRGLEAFAAETGLSLAWGRVFSPYGPGEHPQRVVAAVARAAIAGEPVACSTGEQVRDYLYVEDVAAAFAALVDSGATGCVDIGSGEGIALRDVLLTLEQLAGRHGIVRLGALPDRDEPTSLVADTRRLRDEVGWQPSVELREGLERTLAWWREAILAPRS